MIVVIAVVAVVVDVQSGAGYCCGIGERRVRLFLMSRRIRTLRRMVLRLLVMYRKPGLLAGRTRNARMACVGN